MPEPYYQIGKKYYIHTDPEAEATKLMHFVKCEKGNGQGICSACEGRLVFQNNPESKCGWSHFRGDEYYARYKKEK